MIKICTERSKTSVLVSVFNAESGEKTFKAIVNFFKPYRQNPSRKTGLLKPSGFAVVFDFR